MLFRSVLPGSFGLTARAFRKDARASSGFFSRRATIPRLSRARGFDGSSVSARPKAAREAYSLYVERAAEGANEATGPFSTTGERRAVLDGEVAVPCNPQSATAGLNSLSRAGRVE